MDTDTLKERLDQATNARSGLVKGDYTSAFRLFAGFYEGCPELAVDCYARTLVLYGYSHDPDESAQLMAVAQEHLLARLPWIDCVIRKMHAAPDLDLRRGTITYGSTPADQIQENGVKYAIDLRLNQDTSLYLDTRLLRGWLTENSSDRTVLNLFAYTGALGVAALAGGAARLVQVDRNRKFMEVALRSCDLNQLDPRRMKLLDQDFFNAVAQYKRRGELFDLVFVDPPYQSTTEMGRVDLASDAMRVINKARPLVKNGGMLISINNALFLKGSDYLAGLERLCQDGYLAIEKMIPVPEDITGYPGTITAHPPVDPAPFNHPTKIVILKVKRKGADTNPQ